MKKIISILGLGFALFINAQTLTTSENYVYSKTCLDETCTNKSETVQYVDGLGRAKQIVSIAASPSGKDVVQTIEYDAFGRQAINYLPVPQTGSQGSFYSTPLANANSVYGNERIYSEKIFENDISGQVKQINPVGNTWSAHPLQSETSANTAGDRVKKITLTTSWANNATSYTLDYSADYPANKLIKSIATDADGNTTTEFKNGLGKTILLRKNDGVQPIDTYYVYDEFGNLAYVLPPLALAYTSWSQTVLDDYCYQYKYDSQGRQIEKKLPGKGWEYMIYDQQDRLIMSQDANLGANQQWMFTKYDKFGRVTYTGIANSRQSYGSSGRLSEQNEVNTRGANNTIRTTTSFTQPGLLVYYDNNTAKNYPVNINKLLSVNYYDTYPADKQDVTTLGFTQTLISDNAQTANSISTKTLAVASYLSNTRPSAWTKSYIWYDDRSRPIATYSKNYLGGYSKTETFMDFAGAVQRTDLRHKRKNSSAEIYVKQEYEYDTNYRLINHYHTVNTQPRELLAHNEYKETGQLKTKKVGGSLTDPLQTVDYTYDIRGAMTGINIADDGTFQTGKLFNYKINYNNDLEGLTLPNADFSKPIVKKYNGSIAEVSWRSDQTAGIKRYGYVYDPMGRLLAGLYQNPNNASSKEHSEIITYDANGNIKTLKRSSYFQRTTAIQVDNLQYDYIGNRLNLVQDNPLGTANPSGYEGGGNPISYDDNGNITSMLDKGITSIAYNFLNLPDEIVKGSDSSTEYTYRADGAKLKKTFTLNNDEGTTVIDTEYLDGFQYSTPNTEPIRRALEVQDDATMDISKAGEAEAFEQQTDRVVVVDPGGPVADNMILSFFPTAEGYYDYENMRYIYQYKDHLGNVRVSYVKNSAGDLEVKDTNDYYPFGMSFLKPATRTVYDPMAIPYNYKFGGKELQETGQYDFGARMYMPDLGRWGVVDPLAETGRRWSPYNYALDNPVMFVDPDGMKARDYPVLEWNAGVSESSFLNMNGYNNHEFIGRAGGDDGGITAGNINGGGYNDEIRGISKSDAIKFQQDIFSVLSDPKFGALKALITLNGKSFANIDKQAMDAALNGVNLSADEKAYIDTLVGAINSKDVHKIEYLSLKQEASSDGSNVYRSYMTSILGVEIKGETFGSTIYATGSNGLNIPIDNGSYSFIVETESIFPRYETSMHEALGHGIPSARKLSPSINVANAIRMSNLIRRITGYTTSYRDGKDHGGGIVSFPFNLPMK